MFNWTEYLNLAQYLYGINSPAVNPESALRSCVSRAYYAAYCETRNKAATVGFSINKNSYDHKMLVTFINKRNKKLARYLTDLRIWRNRCDYDDQVNNLQQLAINSLKTATQILQSKI